MPAKGEMLFRKHIDAARIEAQAVVAEEGTIRGAINFALDVMSDVNAHTERSRAESVVERVCTIVEAPSDLTRQRRVAAVARKMDWCVIAAGALLCAVVQELELSVADELIARMARAYWPLLKEEVEN